MSIRARLLLVGLVLGGLCFPSLLFQFFATPTGAMENTLLIGDRFVMPRFGGRQPLRDDVVIFPYPVDPDQTFVKRVIGMPGDRIRIVDKQLIRNGTAVAEPFVQHRTDYVDSYRDNFPSEPNVNVDSRALDMLRNHVVNGEVVVPSNNYFVMGDNRDVSLDSRYWGFVPAASVYGKPLFIYWSIDREIRWERIGRSIH